MAKKLVIEIEDAGDVRQCVTAMRKLFGAMKDHHGFEEADRVWRFYRDPPLSDQRERARLRAACMSFDDDDLRLILKYYAMPKPNKEKLARDLAKQNDSLPQEERHPVKSKEDPAAAILQQIKRAFRFDKEACRIIGEAPEYLRQDKLKEIEGDRRFFSSVLEGLNAKNKKKRHPRPRIRFITMRQRFGGRPAEEWLFKPGPV
jgi:hypothetical protein